MTMSANGSKAKNTGAASPAARSLSFEVMNIPPREGTKVNIAEPLTQELSHEKVA